MDIPAEARVYAGTGAILAGVAVMAGAFGAHGLRDLVTPERLATFETAARYLMYHGLALVVVGWMMTTMPRTGLTWTARLFLAGSALFSGSLFALVLFDWPALGIVTPLGGVAFIAGWLVLARTLLRR
ncbi:MAG: DUF423 domain-containing protein [Rhodothermales bacterium]|nr:DUF423 domain-containing protein [Rhodothermales bacterium]